jgi:hypothetical protein
MMIDGCRDAGVFPDDDSRHVVEESYRIGEPYPQGRMVLHVTEVLPGAGDAREMAALGKRSPRHAGSRLSGVRLTAKGDHHER